MNSSNWTFLDKFEYWNGGSWVAVNQDHASITYSGSWTYENYCTDWRTNNVSGSYAELTFTGTAVRIYDPSDADFTAEVYIDGTLDETINVTMGACPKICYENTTLGSTWTGGHTSSPDWNQADNWSLGVPTTNTQIIYNSSSTARLATGNNNLTLTGTSFLFTNPSNDVTISSGNSISMGSGGIDMSGASRNFTINTALVLGAAQAWNVANGYTLTASGAISGAYTLTKSGTGTVDLTGSVANALTVSAGTLEIGATGPENITTGNFTLSSGATLVTDLDGTTPGPGANGYDQISVTGTVTLGGNLTINLNYDAQLDDVFTIISNDGTGDATSGTLSGKTDGQTFDATYNGQTYTFTISYDGNMSGDNDVVLKCTAVPTPTRTWTGSSSTLWNTAGNWLSSNKPGNSEIVRFNSSSTTNLSTDNDISSLTGMALTVADPSADVTISSTNSYSISLGTSGINMTSATRDLTISCPLTIGGNQSWTIASGRTITVSSGVSGSNTLTKAGDGTAVLSGNNDFTGGVTIGAGKVQLGHVSALGGTGTGTTISAGALDLYGQAVGAEPVSMTGTGISSSGAITNGSGTAASLSGAITLTGAAGVGTSSGTITLSGAIGDGGNGYGLTKYGSGIVILSSTSNSYTGATTISGGTLRLGAAGVIADGSAVSLDNTSGVTFDLNNYNETIGSLAGGGATGGTVSLGSGNLTSGGDNTTTAYAGAISGSGTFIKAGTGTLTLSKDNSGGFSGGVTVSGGTLKMGHASALGGTATGTSVNSGAVLDLNAISVGGETVTISGTGVSSGGAITNSSASAAGLSGAVVLANAASIGAASGDITLSGSISGNYTLTKAGSGTVILSGNSSSWNGAIAVSAGLIKAGGANALGSTSGATTVSSGAALDLNGQTIGAEPVTISGTGISSGGALICGSGSASLSGAVTLAAASSAGGAGNLTLSGAVSGAYTLTKMGAGTLTLSNTVADAVTVSVGTLDATGTISGALSVSAGTLEINASGAENLSCGNFSLSSGATFGAYLGGTTVQTEYDQLVVTGSVTLGGTLAITLDYAPTPGHTYTIISNDVADAVSGTFNGLAQGARTNTVFSSVTYYFTISYTGGDGNDVVLTCVPGPSTWTGGGGDDNWNTSGNWSGGVPQNNSLVQFNASSTARLTTGSNDISGLTGTSIDFDNPSGAVSFSGNAIGLGGAGIDMSGATQNLTIANSLALEVAQTWTVAADRTLTVSGAVSGNYTMTKAGTGTLDATGSFAGAVTISAGTLHIGASGAENVSTGNFNLGASGTQSIHVNGTTAGPGVNGYDQIAVTGTVTLSGSLSMTLGYAAATDDAYTIISNDGSGDAVSGTFNGLAEGAVIMSSFGGSNKYFRISYVGGDGNDVVLTCIAAKVWVGAGAGGTGNRWSTTANWSPAAAPVNNDRIIYNSLSVARLTTGDQNIASRTGLTIEVDNVNPDSSVVINGTDVTGLGGLGIIMSNAAVDLTIKPPMALGAAQTWTIKNGRTLTLSQTTTKISGAFDLTKAGEGTLVLTGNSDAYANTITISQGTVRLANTGGLGTTAAGTVVSSGGALDLNGLAIGAEAVNLNGTGISNAGAITNSSGTAASLSGAITLGSNASVGTSSGNITLSGAIGDGGNGYSFTKYGTGIVILSNASNSYTGATTISGGTLRLGLAAVIADGSAVSLNDAAGVTFDLNSLNETIGSLAGGGTTGGTVSMGTGNLTCGGDNSTTTYSGVISGSGTLTKTGTGTLTLGNDNSSGFTGAVTVSAGVLKLGHASALGGTATGTTVSSDAALDINGVSVGAEPVTISGTGISNGGVLISSAGSAALSGEVTLNSAVNNYIGGAGNLEISGLVTDGANTYTLTKVGAGTLTLSKSTGNTYDGATTISAGTLLVTNSSGSGTGTAAVTLNGGTLGGTGTSSGAVTVNSGATVSPGVNGAGTLTLGSTLTFSSGSTFDIEINNAGSYDRVATGGAAACGSATLSITLGFVPDLAQTFTIIENTSGSSNTAGFDGIAEGENATAVYGGITYYFRVNYNAGTGNNDVVLTCVSGGASKDADLTSVVDATTTAYAGQNNICFATARFDPSGSGTDPTLQSVTITANDAGGAIGENSNLASVRAYSSTSSTPSTTTAYGSAGAFSSNSSGTVTFTDNLTIDGTKYIHFYCNVKDGIENSGNLKTSVSFTASSEGTGDPSSNGAGSGLTFNNVQLLPVTVTPSVDGSYDVILVSTDDWSIKFHEQYGGGISFLSPASGGAGTNQIENNLFYWDVNTGNYSHAQTGTLTLLASNEFSARVRQEVTVNTQPFTIDYTVYGSGKIYALVSASSDGGLSARPLEFRIANNAAAGVTNYDQSGTAGTTNWLLHLDAGSDGGTPRFDVLLGLYEDWTAADAITTDTKYTGIKDNGWSLSAGQKQVWEFLIDFAHQGWDDNTYAGNHVSDYRTDYAGADSLALMAGTFGMERAWENNIRGHWTFNEGTGTSAYDFSGNGRTGTVSGSDLWTTSGKFGGGLLFDADDKVTVSSHADLDCAGELTVMAWIKTSQTTGTDSLLSRHDGTNGWQFLRVGNVLRLKTNGGYLDGTVTTGSNTWRHVAATYRGSVGRIRLFVDGKLDKSGIDTEGADRYAVTGGTGLGLEIGFGYSGTIDDVRVYQQEISEETIKAIAQRGYRSAEGLYMLRADDNSTMHFTVNGGTVEHYYPVFHIANYWAAVEPTKVYINGTQVTEAAGDFRAVVNTSNHSLLIGFNRRITTNSYRIFIDDNDASGGTLPGTVDTVYKTLAASNPDSLIIKNFSGNTFGAAETKQFVLKADVTYGTSTQGNGALEFYSSSETRASDDWRTGTNLVYTGGLMNAVKWRYASPAKYDSSWNASVVNAADIGITVLDSSAVRMKVALDTVKIKTGGGTSTIGSSDITGVDEDPGANTMVAISASLGQTATIASLKFYVTQAAGKFRLGIYDNSGGLPGTLKAETAELTPSAGSWNSGNVGTPVSLASGTYWLACITNNASFMGKAPAGGTTQWKNQAYGAFPASFGTPGGSWAVTYAIQATFDLPVDSLHYLRQYTFYPDGKVFEVFRVTKEYPDLDELYPVLALKTGTNLKNYWDAAGDKRSAGIYRTATDATVHGMAFACLGYRKTGAYSVTEDLVTAIDSSTTTNEKRIGFKLASATLFETGDIPYQIGMYYDVSRDFASTDSINAVNNAVLNTSDALRFVTGSLVQSAGDDDFDGNGFSEAEGCWIMNASSNSVHFRLDAKTYPRFNPVFKINNYTSTMKPQYVFLYTHKDAAEKDSVRLYEGYHYSMYHDRTNSRLIMQIDTLLTDSALIYMAVDPTLAVTMSLFQAVGGDRSDTLFWRTESEESNLGFLLYRRIKPAFYDGIFASFANDSVDSVFSDARSLHKSRALTAVDTLWKPITRDLIPGAPGGNSYASRDYRYVDRGIHNGVLYEYKLVSVDFASVHEEYEEFAEAMPRLILPKNFLLRGNFPNPFRGHTMIRFDLPVRARISLEIYSMQGRLVRRLITPDRPQEAGFHMIRWDARDDAGRMVGTGPYIYRLVSGKYRKARMMVKVR